ncbi:MAG: FtsX-like permease family protein [bacterium]|nr:FtsX-like permease family protein [bacterium]
MFKNYLKIALRNILRYKGYSFINIAGLAVGMTASILIFLYVQYELSYDKYHENADNIYRIVNQNPGSYYMGTDKYVWTSALLAPAMKSDLSGVMKAVRIDEVGRGASLKYENNCIHSDKFYFTDSDFLEMFTFPLIKGDPKTALNAPFSVLITEEMADILFSDDEPMGKVLRFNNTHDLTITGVLNNVPDNSHFRFDFLASFNTIFAIENESNWNSWGSKNYSTYVLLNDMVDITEFNDTLQQFRQAHMEGSRAVYVMEPLPGIHLNGNIPGDLEVNSSIVYIYSLTAVAFLIIIIACCNYLNLSTARAAKRSKEVGLRKVIGASRRQLIRQFLGESVLLTIIAFTLSIFLVYLLLPFFNSMIDRNLEFNILNDATIMTGLPVLVVILGLLSGFYPALLLSSFKPLNLFKGGKNSGSKTSAAFRNSVVVLQFAVSLALIISSIFILRQLDYIRNKELGFDKDSIITLKINEDFNDSIISRFDEFKNELKTDPNIIEVSSSYWLPTEVRSGSNPYWEGQQQGESILIHNLRSGYDFIDLYNIELLEGRDFSREYGADLTNSYIVNETALELMGLTDPIGNGFGLRWRDNGEGKIIGVVKDFHCNSMYLSIRPIVIRLDPSSVSHISIKIKPGNIQETISYIEDKWTAFSPGFAFEYSFVDDIYMQMYATDMKLGQAFNYFTVIALFLACLGLLGLVSYTAESKTKEIGIRKTLGASIRDIIGLIVNDFLKWIIFASFIAAPLAYFAMSDWLQKFAYRIDITADVFLFSILIAVLATVITVTYRSIRAALANPVDSLRYE